MSNLVSNAEEMLNTKGFISPYFLDYGIKVRILTDDMAASDSLKIVNENGEKVMFTNYYQYLSAYCATFSMAVTSALLLTSLF